MNPLGVIYSLIIFGTLRLANCHTPIYNGTIGGDRTLLECVAGTIKSEENLAITIVDVVKKAGYTIEEHIVSTEDGYLLTLHRIPGVPGAPPVFLQHGLMSSSFDWLLTGKGTSLGFLLVELGYDLWLGNTRGNTYCQCHKEFQSKTSEFWDFSWHEMGIYDLPATITYVTNLTKQRIIYIGHSMGTTMSYVMAIERPDIAARVKVIFSLAPVAYLTHSKSSLVMLAPYTKEMQIFTAIRGQVPILSKDPIMKPMIKGMCSGPMVMRKVCAQVLFNMMGFDEDLLDYDLLPIAMHHFPSGCSLKAFIHYFQVKNADRFQRFDYGPERNYELYFSEAPPLYDISKIQVPVGLIWSGNDYFTNESDYKKLKAQVQNIILDYKVPYEKFNHLDFIIARRAKEFVYDKLISTMERFRYVA